MSAATGALKPVLEKLATLVGDKYKRFKHVHREVSLLRDELATMHAFLLEMLEEESPNERDKLWMKEVRELSYDMEDCVDDFIQDIESDGFIEEMKNWLGMMMARGRTASEIHGLKKQVIELSKRNGRYKTEVRQSNASHKVKEDFSQTMNKGTLHARALVRLNSTPVAIDKPKAEIIKLLTEVDGCGSPEQLKIVSIVGSGGMGKTTLANQVYQELKVGFQCLAFLSVSRSPNMMNILRRILSQVSRQPYANTIEGSEEDLVLKINEFLQDKRYFIVVDDIWSVDTWDIIKRVFPKTSIGSRIITTTRINAVAKSCRSSFNGHIHDIGPLDIEHSRQVFCRIVFGPKEHCPSHLEEVLNQILKKCDGLPLAIIAISGLLANKESTVSKWNEVKDSIGRALERNNSVENMMKILSLSYFDLPSDLKTCLLYLSIFPEDTIIEKKNLIRRWIAEGIIHKDSRYTIHEVGEMYFNELVNRCLVQPVKDRYDHKVTRCRVHDVILDFIVSKSIEDNFITLVGVPCVPINDKMKVRRLSLQNGGEGNSTLPKHLVLSHARSLSVFGNTDGIPPLNVFIHLRILDFGGIKQLKEHYLTNIGMLLHLRYINLRGTGVSKLPKGIRHLRYLEMLDLRSTEVGELPASLLNLRKLVYLLTDGAVKFPDGIMKLEALEVLKRVRVFSQTSNFLQELGQLKNLRKLFITLQDDSSTRRETEEINELYKVTASSLRSLVSLNLRSLKIMSGGSFLQQEPLCPAMLNLQKLILIRSPVQQVPEWMLLLVNLQELRIEVEGIRQKDLCILGSLPALLILEVEARGCSKDAKLTVGGEVGFPCLLKFLYYIAGEGMNLMFTTGSMPMLEMLKIYFEPDETKALATGAFEFGLGNLPRLATVEVGGLTRASRVVQAAAKACLERAVRAHPNRPALLNDTLRAHPARRFRP